MKSVHTTTVTAHGSNRSEKAMAFINELVAVCRKYDMHIDN